MWQIIFLFPVILFFGFLFVLRTVRSIRETARLFATTKSPVISYLTETVNGASTIRAFNRQEEFIEVNLKQLNDNILGTTMMTAVNSWFSVRVDFLALSVVLILSFLCIFLRNSVDPVLLSLMLNYSLNIQFALMNLLKGYMSIEQQMVNIDRCLKMTEIEHEREIDFKKCPNYLKNRPDWPEHGAVEFRGVKLRYRPDTDVVLNGITYKVK